MVRGLKYERTKMQRDLLMLKEMAYRTMVRRIGTSHLISIILDIILLFAYGSDGTLSNLSCITNTKTHK